MEQVGEVVEEVEALLLIAVHFRLHPRFNSLMFRLLRFSSTLKALFLFFVLILERNIGKAHLIIRILQMREEVWMRFSF